MSNLSYNTVRSGDGIGCMLKILAKERNGIKISHINAQSLTRKIKEFRYIFENSGSGLKLSSLTYLFACTDTMLEGLTEMDMAELQYT